MVFADTRSVRAKEPCMHMVLHKYVPALRLVLLACRKDMDWSRQPKHAVQGRGASWEGTAMYNQDVITFHDIYCSL
jgi:hypothetical protein